MRVVFIIIMHSTDIYQIANKCVFYQPEDYKPLLYVLSCVKCQAAILQMTFLTEKHPELKLTVRNAKIKALNGITEQ